MRTSSDTKHHAAFNASKSSATAVVLDKDQIAERCRSALPDHAHRSLLSAFGSLYPQIPFSVSRTLEGWYRIGGVITASGERVTDDLVHWAYREGENDFAGLLDYCRKEGLFATRIDGKVHYIVAPVGHRAQDFIQIEVEETQEWLDRPLCGDMIPLDIEDFVDPLTKSMAQDRPLGPPRYKLKRLTPIADLLSSMQLKSFSETAVSRFIQDWDRSSAKHHHRFCHHWVLELHSYIGRYDEQCHSIVPCSSYSQPIPHLDNIGTCHGLQLANQIRHFDRKLGYPMAWYFHMLKRDRVPSHLVQAVIDDYGRGFAYLPEIDRQLIQKWLERPYMF